MVTERTSTVIFVAAKSICLHAFGARVEAHERNRANQAYYLREARRSYPAYALVRGYFPGPHRSDQFGALDDLFARHAVLTLIHIVPGLFFMLLGPLQFSTKIRARHPEWHRLSGRIFVICGMVIGISALVMSFGMPAIGGVPQAAATALFGAFFLFALAKAFWHIRRREIVLHREWMLRAFAIGLAVATIRLIVGVFFATTRLSGLAPREFFGIAFWIGFVLHLIAAEAWLHITQTHHVAVNFSD